MLFQNKKIPQDFENIHIQSFTTGLLETNTYLISEIDNHVAVLIDPAGDSSEIDDFLKEQKLQLNAIWLTHGHYDHIGGLQAFLDRYKVEAWIHTEDAQMLKNPEENLASFFNIPFEPISTDHFLSHDQNLYWGNVNFRVLHTPGHTRGSVCFLGDGFVISGDTLFRNSIGRSDFPQSSPHDLIQSIHDYLLPLPDETVVFSGHGMYTTIGHERKNNPFLR